MVDLNTYKVPIFPGVNDQVVFATAEGGCNGTFICFAINNIVDEVELLKAQPSGGSSNITFTKNQDVSDEFNYITLTSSAPCDLYLTTVSIDILDYFIEFYLEVNGNQRLITDTSNFQVFTVDEPAIRAGDAIDLVLVADEQSVIDGYSESIQVQLTASLSPLS